MIMVKYDEYNNNVAQHVYTCNQAGKFSASQNVGYILQLEW